MKLIRRIAQFAFANAIFTAALGGAAHAQTPIETGPSVSTPEWSRRL